MKNPGQLLHRRLSAENNLNTQVTIKLCDSTPRMFIQLKRSHIRIIFGTFLILSGVPIAMDSLALMTEGQASKETGPAVAESSEDRPEYVPSSVPPLSGTLVVTVDKEGVLAAYDENGDLLYWNDTYPTYADVDPLPSTKAAVLYTARYHDPTACAGGACSVNVVERVNLTTGNVTRLYQRTWRNNGSVGVHDVDRINDTHLLVGQIAFPDQAYIVNTTSNEIDWRWRVDSEYKPSSGGVYPDDWTHLNDVSYLSGGRVMVNLRNQDQVVFIHNEDGFQYNWTLGKDDNHSILYEPHNPDYIPAEHGGPAVIVAGSENNRIIEYQRRNGKWKRSWVWADIRMQWPRDADRLPNGHTLITDTHSNRVFLVNKSGAITWKATGFSTPYESEILETGRESTGGPSAEQANINSRQPDDQEKSGSSHISFWSPLSDIHYTLKSLVPNPVIHGIQFVLPSWISTLAVYGLLFGVLTATMWAGIEVRWRM